MHLLLALSTRVLRLAQLFDQRWFQFTALHIVMIGLSIFTVSLAYHHVPNPSDVKLDTKFKRWYVTPIKHGDGISWIKNLCEQNKRSFCHLYKLG